MTPRTKEDPPIVEIKQGRVQGVKKPNGILSFRGIPYATAERFKKPTPCAPWSDTRDATTFGKTSVQPPDVLFFYLAPRIISSVVRGALWLVGRDPLNNLNPQRPKPVPAECDENECLNLNVETPSLSGSKPVMVFIHGGSFVTGSGSLKVYQPPESALASKGVVLVTINYRLGLLGFLKVEGGDWNCGIWDQIAALDWVHENIARFGGDPSNVTIFGESAGGMSVATLCAAAPTASPGGPIQGRLFKRAIMQSGASQVGCTPADALTLTAEVERLLEMESGSASIDSLGTRALAELLAAQNVIMEGRRCGVLPLQPVVDGELLAEGILGSWAKGSARGLDIMLTYNKDEELFWYKSHPQRYISRGQKELHDRVLSLVGPEALGLGEPAATTNHALQELARDGKLPNWDLQAVLFGSLVKFAIPTHQSAEVLVHSASSVYMCRFDVSSPFVGGAAHALELPFVFGSFRQLPRVMPRAPAHAIQDLSDAMVTAWTTFAASGDPNPSGDGASSSLPFWPKLKASEPHLVMTLDVPTTKCAVETVDIKESFPTLWKITVSSFPIWCHPPSDADGFKHSF